MEEDSLQGPLETVHFRNTFPPLMLLTTPSLLQLPMACDTLSLVRHFPLFKSVCSHRNVSRHILPLLNNDLSLSSSILLTWRWRGQVLPKCCYLPTTYLVISGDSKLNIHHCGTVQSAVFLHLLVFHLMVSVSSHVKFCIKTHLKLFVCILVST
jgi:hypothetical protein